jgi:hypothetical protein
MDPCTSARDLERSGRALCALAEGLPPETARWKPAPGSWSVLEVLNHLLDEERDDFRRRLDALLHRRGTPWPPIDPVGWSVSRKYNERDLGETLSAFAAEREASLAWLRELSVFDAAAGDPAQAALHPRLAELRAGDLLASWVAHDLLHLRQLTRLRFQHLEAAARPYRTEYAGSW